MNNRIDAAFAKGDPLFIPYITAGHPDVESTIPIMHALVENGADIIELGFPFSDPTADGAVIQRSSQIALENGFLQEDYFNILEEFRKTNSETPVVVFGYFNPIFHYGVEAFVNRIAELGGDGFLIVDMPFEEQEQIRTFADAAGLHLIQLIAPTTPDDRLQRICSNASGFIYQISIRGVTGARTELASDAASLVERAKNCSDLPVALGFGVSTPEQAREISSVADAVVVGSAIVNAITAAGDSAVKDAGDICKTLAEAVHG